MLDVLGDLAPGTFCPNIFHWQLFPLQLEGRLEDEGISGDTSLEKVPLSGPFSWLSTLDWAQHWAVGSLQLVTDRPAPGHAASRIRVLFGDSIHDRAH